MLIKAHIVKAMVFLVVMYRCESWTIKKPECQKIDAFKLRCWRRLLRVPWTAWRSNQSILKEINPEYSLEGLILKLKLQRATWCEEPIQWKRPWCWGKLRAGEGDNRGWDGWMISLPQWTWVEQTLGDNEGQGSLACCSPSGGRDGYNSVTEQQQQTISLYFTSVTLFLFFKWVHLYHIFIFHI